MRCERCQRFVFFDNETCHCEKYEVCIDDYFFVESDWREIYSIHDESDVAEIAAKQYYRDDPIDPHKFEVTVRVRKAGEFEYKTFTVTAQAAVDFYAEETK